MIQEGKIGIQEAISLVVITICAKVFFTSPAYLTRFVGTAGWYMTLISNATAILAFAFICHLLKRFPEKDIIEIFNISMGRFIGFIFSLAFSIFFMLSAGTYIREFLDVLSVFAFPDTPSSFLIIALIIAVIVAVFSGLETIARVAKLVSYLMLLSLIFVVALASQSFKFTNIFPILGYGIDKTIIHGLQRSSAYNEVVMLAVFAGSLQGIKHIRKIGFISLIISGTIISIVLLSFLLVFKYNTAQELTAPIYVMARNISYGVFLERLDPIFIFVWNISAFISISAVFYCSVSTYCKLFKLQDIRPVIIPMSIILMAVALTPKDITSVVTGYVQALRGYGWTVIYLLPLIALLTSLIRKKKGEVKNA